MGPVVGLVAVVPRVTHDAGCGGSAGRTGYAGYAYSPLPRSGYAGGAGEPGCAGGT